MVQRSTPSTPIRVLFLYNSVSPRVLSYIKNRLRDFTNVEIIIPESLSIPDLIPLAQKANVILGWNCPEELFPYIRHIKLYITPYTGLSYLIRKFRKMNPPPQFPIVNSHGGAKLIAQHAVAMLFGILNHLVIHHMEMLDGTWIPGGEGVDERFPTIPIEGRNIGLFGYGHINQNVHKYLQGLSGNFHILKRSWDNFQNQQAPTKFTRYTPDQLDIFMEKIDTLIIAAPLTPETREAIKMKQLELLGKNGKKGIIVNVGRSKIINEKDLFTALKENIIARAALDVWYIYNPEPDSHNRLWPYSKPFNTLKNVLLSPHRADSPFDHLSRWDDVIENIKRAALGRTDFLNLIDVERGY